MSRRDRIVIANCGGFWGDDPTAARRQVAGGPVDYLVMDYLAEITMAILQKQRAKDPSAGYAKDFLAQLRDVLVPCAERGIRILSNAGGVNPTACAAAVEALAAELGVADRVRVAVVAGDDLFPDLGALQEAGHPLTNLDTGAPLRDVPGPVLSANVYLGSAPLVAALDAGATVVVAGRVTDTSLALAPMMHEFGWADTDWDRLAAGIIAGHIIECGSQCTGGNFTDWESVPSLREIGFPLIEASADGSFVVTKHPNTGGLVSVDTVREQLLYEMGAPGYLSPDCVARFDSITLTQQGPDRVLVTGARGEAPPERLKVAISYAGGYRAVGRMLISGPNVLAKAHRAAEVFWDAAGGTAAYDAALTQFVGWDASHPSLASEQPSEVLMQVSVRDADRSKIEQRFAPMVVGTMLSSMPGMTMPGDQGRPRPSEVVSHWGALLDRSAVTASVTVGGVTTLLSCALPAGAGTTGPLAAASPDTAAAPAVTSPTGAAPGDPAQETVPLIRLCLARSGDKGDTANVGVLARSEQIYDWLLECLTAEQVKVHFKDVCHGTVERFALPNLRAVNFLLHHSLGGGGTSSLQFDAQGKTYAQFLLAMPVTVPAALLATAG